MCFFRFGEDNRRHFCFCFNLFFFVRISLELIDPNDILDKKQNAKVHVAYKNNLKG